jgi:type IV secretion system protein VirD4
VFKKLKQKIAKVKEYISERFPGFWEKLPGRITIVAAVLYFYGMLVNSVRLGIKQTFDAGGSEIGSIWTANPIKNFIAPFTPEGLVITAACILLFCLITKKGYIWFSGYKYTHDKRGFDILPDATHGSSGFMSKKDMAAVLNLESIEDAKGTIIGKTGEIGAAGGKYASLKTESRLDNHTIVFGSTGSGKSRDYVRPFLFQAADRGESVILVDPKAELYESTAEYMRGVGYTVKVFNLLDPDHSDGWNPLHDIEQDRTLVDSIAEIIIKNTSNATERQDFWEKAEKNLLQALMHYVQNTQIPGTSTLLPIEKRSFGAIYRLLSDESFAELEGRFNALPRSHPAKAPYGIFKLAHRQIWGNIAIGLGNRLSVFQNKTIDEITAHNDIDLALPGKRPCIYYCVISAQDSRYEFLSSLFFSCITSRLIDFARREGDGGRLPVKVHLLLEEFCNIGNLGADFLKQLAILRGFNINCQLLVQSVPQLAGRYPKAEWEELISHCDVMICLGANDLKTGTYISDKCGKVTIRTDSNQMPLMPLFSPVYHSTRPYSQTKSSTQRALMMPDEILRMDNGKCLILLRGQKPLILRKITPEEFPVYEKLKSAHITEYTPEWREDGLAGSDATPEKDAGAAPCEDTGRPARNPRRADSDAYRSHEQIEIEGLPAETPGIESTERTDANGIPGPKTKIHAAAWYPKTEYSLSGDDETQSERVTAKDEPTISKYGALRPVGITPDYVRKKGVALQDEEEQS